MVLIPLIFGVGMLFYNGGNPRGWLIAVGDALIMLAFGVISQIHFLFNSMSAFDLITILVLLVSGISLFLSSLRAEQQPFFVALPAPIADLPVPVRFSMTINVVRL